MPGYSLIVFANAAGNRVAQGFADRFKGDAIEHLLEEADHDHSHCFFAGKTASHGVEDLFFVDPTGSSPVRAANVVGFDL